jgi:hypothetical protein
VTEQGPDRRRVTVAEASEILGITAEAVRTRIKRGRLDSVKEPPDRTGTVYVLLEADQTGPNIDPTLQGQDQASDQTRQDEGLVEALREQVAYLQGVIATRDWELVQRAEEIRRRDAALGARAATRRHLRGPAPRAGGAGAHRGARIASGSRGRAREGRAAVRCPRRSGGRTEVMVAQALR